MALSELSSLLPSSHCPPPYFSGVAEGKKKQNPGLFIKESSFIDVVLYPPQIRCRGGEEMVGRSSESIERYLRGNGGGVPIVHCTLLLCESHLVAD